MEQGFHRELGVGELARSICNNGFIENWGGGGGLTRSIRNKGFIEN